LAKPPPVSSRHVGQAAKDQTASLGEFRANLRPISEQDPRALTACKGGYQTHRISGAHGRLKLPKKPDILVINENQNGTTDPTVGLAQSVINPIEALLQLQEHLPKGSGPDFDRLFTITQSTELRRDQNFNHGLGSSKKTQLKPD
jgi:hypothetical protein